MMIPSWIKKFLEHYLCDNTKLYGHFPINDRYVVIFSDMLRTEKGQKNLADAYGVSLEPDSAVRLYKINIVDAKDQSGKTIYGVFIRQGNDFIKYIFNDTSNLVDGLGPDYYPFDKKFTSKTTRGLVGNKIVYTYCKVFDNCTICIHSRKTVDMKNATFYCIYTLSTQNFMLALEKEQALELFGFDKETKTLLEAMQLHYPLRSKEQNDILVSFLGKDAIRFFKPLREDDNYKVYANIFDNQLKVFKDNEPLKTLDAKAKRLLDIVLFTKDRVTLDEILQFHKNVHFIKRKNYGIVEKNDIIYFVYVKSKHGIVPLKIKGAVFPRYEGILRRILEFHKKRKEAIKKLSS